jgi:ABC-type uncharacterized transport system permease subunit
MAVIAATAVLCAVLYTVFRYSKVGIAMQAASQNQLAAYYMGIPVKRLNSLVWGLAAGVAAIAGLLLAPITFVHANMGFIGLKAFPAAVVGGFGSLPGAIGCSARDSARRSDQRFDSSSRPTTTRTSDWPSTAATCSGTACSASRCCSRRCSCRTTCWRS